VSYWVVTRDTEPASVVFLPKSRERREGQGGLGGSGGHGYDELCIWGGWRPGLVDEVGRGKAFGGGTSFGCGFCGDLSACTLHSRGGQFDVEGTSWGSILCDLGVEW